MPDSTFPDIISAVGCTPLIKLNRIAAGLPAQIWIKAEFLNPLGSVKDRIARAMVEAAERDGRLRPGSVVIEPTSGNTGIALAFVCAMRGYRLRLAMPETMSVERRMMLRLLGAEIVLTPGPEGMPGAIRKAQELMAEHGADGFMPQQFENPANPEVHRRTTAEEIWAQSEGRIDAFVSGVGSGGTITGVSEVIKTRRAMRSIAVEPAASPVLSGGKAGRHRIQGIGTGFIPKNCNTAVIDEVIQVSDEDAIQTTRELGVKEGILGGISTGANVWAALQVAKRPEFAGKLIVTVACSAGERELSTALTDQVREEVTV